ncbi:Arc family DNA-binding protein [Stutzerimonas nitrititolerans]|uniref:Arc family DNA-binding protein n=1 Tax=Stutzerimonas nitrititolerans TaxID=2482751 RepID=UPI0028A2A20D|nr:Arc family DNA-binding protein [Stutzerimonas nitrititolerans]
MSRMNITKFVARLPHALHEEIKETARANHRSMNSEIIHRLQQPVAPGMGITQLTLNVDSKEASASLERMLEDLKSAKAFNPIVPAGA